MRLFDEPTGFEAARDDVLDTLAAGGTRPAAGVRVEPIGVERQPRLRQRGRTS